MGLATVVFAALALSGRSNNITDPEKGVGGRVDDDADGDDEDNSYNGGDAEDTHEGASRMPEFQNMLSANSQPAPSTLLMLPRTNTTDTSLSTATSSVFTKAKQFIFPPEDPTALERFVPNYRWTPIISGVVIPFSILLEIPGLTERWYIRTEGGQTVETKSNPPILDSGLAVSIACALIANICLILRFLEWKVRTTTLLCIAFLTIHDIINIVTVTIFGVEHRFDDGFTYGQAFWMTVSSTAVSSVTNVTLIVDFVRTPDFGVSGSGLTRKQRSLVIIVIVLLVYIAFGALITSLIQDLSFINGLYFTVVTIETIGFGDITPNTTGARIFICFYMIFGILNIGLAVAMCRETVLEGLEIGYRKRLRRLRMLRREARRFRKWEVRWRRAVEWRLRDKGLPVWVHDRHFAQEAVRFTGLAAEHEATGYAHWMRTLPKRLGFMKADRDPDARGRVQGHPKHKHLNIDALSSQQLEAAALEAGVPLDMFLDPQGGTAAKPHVGGVPRNSDLERNTGHPYSGMGRRLHRTASLTHWPTHPQTPTHAQIGRMASMITEFALAIADVHVRMMGSGNEVSADERPEYVERNQVVEAAQDENEAAVSLPTKKINTIRFHDDASESRKGTGSQEQPSQASELREAMDDDAGRDTQPLNIGATTSVPEWAKELSQPASERSAFSYERYREDMASEERKAYFAKLTVAWSLFLLFWFIGSAIFSATEGWAYGTAMYFCFIAFTTTGYGDLAPVTPAGRSIFVVWALMGVATMTILISVIQEAGSSRYKRALHSRMFDNAVKEFRKREIEETNRVAHERLSPFLLQEARRGSTLVPQKDRDAEDDNEVTPGMLDAIREIAQRDLEELPAEIVRHARTFQDHLRFFVNHAHDIVVGDGAGVGPEEKLQVPQELKALFDEVSNLEEIGARGKREILQDEDARKTLFILSMERILRQMINAAEKSMAIMTERDSLIAEQCESQRRELYVHQEEGSEYVPNADIQVENRTQPSDTSSSIVSKSAGTSITT